jgi:hypothetical protein
MNNGGEGQRVASEASTSIREKDVVTDAVFLRGKTTQESRGAAIRYDVILRYRYCILCGSDVMTSPAADVHAISHESDGTITIHCHSSLRKIALDQNEINRRLGLRYQRINADVWQYNSQIDDDDLQQESALCRQLGFGYQTIDRDVWRNDDSQSDDSHDYLPSQGTSNPPEIFNIVKLLPCTNTTSLTDVMHSPFRPTHLGRPLRMLAPRGGLRACHVFRPTIYKIAHLIVTIEVNCDYALFVESLRQTNLKFDLSPILPNKRVS